MFSFKGIICSILGLLLALWITVAIIFDDDQVAYGRETISRWSMAYGLTHWYYPLALTAFGVGVVMTLATHLWLPRVGPTCAYEWSLFGAFIGVVLGYLIASVFFLQR